MKKQQYEITIQAPATKVSAIMLTRETYKQWTAEFNPTSDYEGGWNKGDKILFIGLSKEGKKEGMVAEIAEHIPNRFISIRHRGLLDGDNEITEGPAVDGWAGALENYSFSENNGATTVSVELDITEEFAAYFDQTWPKALSVLKKLCEQE